MKKHVCIRLVVEGLHYWSDCNIPEVAYLKTRHRHLFHIEVKLPVTHSNRDIEFIEFKHKLITWLDENFHSAHYQCLDFAHRSCEHIAELLLQQFPELDCASVFEDNENGAIVSRS